MSTIEFEEDEINKRRYTISNVMKKPRNFLVRKGWAKNEKTANGILICIILVAIGLTIYNTGVFSKQTISKADMEKLLKIPPEQRSPTIQRVIDAYNAQTQ